MIKSTFLFLGLIFNSSLFAQEEAGLLENNFLKDIMIKSMTIVEIGRAHV